MNSSFSPRFSRRQAFGAGLILLSSVALGAAGLGCSNNQSVSLTDLADDTASTLGDLLLGAPSEATAMSPPDASLLKKGGKESVLVAADTAGFAAESKGAIPENALKDVRRDVVKMLNRRLERRGFSAIESQTFPPAPPTDDKTLVATLVPVTEVSGSPADKARGKERTMVLVRLTVTDPATGAVLRQRDYYSGKDVQTSPTPTPT